VAGQIDTKRLALAIVAGLALQFILVLVGLHADPLLDRVCGDSVTCVRIAQGIYLTLGIGIVLLVVPWSRFPIRLATVATILVTFEVFAALARQHP